MKTKITSFTTKKALKYLDTGEEIFYDSSVSGKDDMMRGVWFSTVANIDFKISKTPEEAKRQIDDMITVMKKYHLNSVFFQVHPLGDSFSSSKLCPVSRFITGEELNSYPIDIFKILVEKCHKEKIDVHAWINPYRVSNKSLEELNLTKEEYLNTLGDKSFARQNKDLVLETSLHKLILDPASEKVQNHIRDLVLELANNYDIKSIHMDDYFYPYEELIDLKEEEKMHKISKCTTVASFRRENVTKLISKISNSLKGKTEFGISPFAVWDTNTNCFPNHDGGSKEGSYNSYKAFTCYHGLYADVLGWMKDGLIDYVVPQIYFAFDEFWIKDSEEIRLVTYHDLAKWWSTKALETNTKLYIGQGLYRVGSQNEWTHSEELLRQLKFNHSFPNVLGSVFFTYHNFTDEEETLKKVQKELIKYYED